MAEYIELEKFVALLESERAKAFLLCMPKELKEMYAAGIQKTIQLAKKTFAADLKVVRCKECKHKYSPLRCALWQGMYDGNDYFIERGDDFYCSFGEKKEGADE